MNILSRISGFKQSMSQRQVPFEHKYLLQARLGDGSFAKVYACSTIDGNESKKGKLAVKVFDRKSQRGLRREFRNEHKLMAMVTANEHCVKMLDFFEGHRFCHIVMEKASCSVQEAFLKSSKGGSVNEQDLAHVFKCMLLGVQHLHTCNVVHRDIKPANLLLTDGDSLANKPVVKVCDLGLAAQIPSRGKLTEVCGTAPYMAPEMLKKQAYTIAVDLWSCGVTAYLMLLGGFPYPCIRNDTKQMKAAIMEGKVTPTFKAHPGFPQPSDAAIAFLKNLLTRNPEVRADSPRALSSPYISSSSQPASLSLPSFGPTLSIAHDTTKDEPAAETPIVRNIVETGGNLSSEDSTTCGGSSDDKSSEDEAPRRIRTSSISSCNAGSV
jgi:serine/threonine protein kinase